MVYKICDKKLLSGVLILVLILFLAACKVGGGGNDKGEKKGKDGEEKKGPEAIRVEVAALEKGPIEAVLRFASNLEAERDVMVHAQAPRIVEKLLVEEGHQVKAGQLLLQLQDEEQKTALAKIESQLRRERKELARQENLYKQNMISEQTFVDASYQVEQLELALEDAKRNLEYTEVRAPIAGTVTQRLVNLGDFITVNQALFQIVDFDSIVARIYVPEQDVVALSAGRPARVTPNALGDVVFQGKIDRISPMVDPGTGTVKVTVAIPLQEGLMPGMYVEVALIVATHDDAVRVPKKALVYDNDQIFVFRLVEDRKVERVRVLPALEDPEFVEPAEGLAEGDQIVLAGQAGLKDGATVKLPGDPDEEEEKSKT